MHISDMLNPERRPEPTFQQKKHNNPTSTSTTTPRSSTNSTPPQMTPISTSQQAPQPSLLSQGGYFASSTQRHHGLSSVGAGGPFSYPSAKMISPSLPPLSSTGVHGGNERLVNNPYTTESAEAKNPLLLSRHITPKTITAQYHPPMVASSDPMFKSTAAYTSPPAVHNHIPGKPLSSGQTSLSALAAAAIDARPPMASWEQSRDSFDVNARYQHQHQYAPNMDGMTRPPPQHTGFIYDPREQYQPRGSAAYTVTGHNYSSNTRNPHVHNSTGHEARPYYNHNNHTARPFQTHTRETLLERTPSPTTTSPISPPHGSGESPVPAADDMHKCSYMDNCETGSPLRKVVSHFFGRNKLATRKIPMHLWVYFCRKHYQRSRYRNPRGFATLQIQLVQTQIENLQEWGGVVDWTIKVRRREELRSRTAGNHNPDQLTPLEMDGLNLDDSIRAGGRGTAHRRRGSGGGGSIPSHYLQYVGEHKTTDEVRNLVAAIRADMEQNGGTFPDLELLPRLQDEASTNREENDADNDNSRTKKNGKQGVSRSNTLKRPARPSVGYGGLSVGPTHTNSEIYPTAMKRKSDNRIQSDEDVQSPDSEHSGYGPETMSCPSSPSKRPKLFCQPTEEGTMPHPISRSMSQRQRPHHSQTMTPPPSASSIREGIL